MESLDNVFNACGDGQFVNITVTRKRIESKYQGVKEFHMLVRIGCL